VLADLPDTHKRVRAKMQPLIGAETTLRTIYQKMLADYKRWLLRNQGPDRTSFLAGV
jgi:hypothetical protein